MKRCLHVVLEGGETVDTTTDEEPNPVGLLIFNSSDEALFMRVGCKMARLYFEKLVPTELVKDEEDQWLDGFASEDEEIKPID